LKPIVFIIPWFHEQIGGGAEMCVRDYATRLIARGRDVEVWCTCCRDFHDNWNIDHWPAGLADVNGIPTRRFPVRHGNHAVYNSLNARLLGGDRLKADEEQAFFRESINSDALLEHIRAHGTDRHLIFTPYMYGTTFNGLRVHSESSFLFPEFHNEPYAHLRALREPVESAQGHIFLSAPEQELANHLFDIGEKPQCLAGMGIEPLPAGDPEGFRQRHGLGDDPFILYAGRQSSAKNVGLLCDFFLECRKQEPESKLKLVLIGKPDMKIPEHPDIRALGFVSQEDKVSAHRAATLLCQPSVNESFSIVLFESWTVEVPVLVNGWCDVTRHHCEVSGGGLWFESLWEFQEAVRWMLDNPGASMRMGAQGAEHVRRNCRWAGILDKFESALAAHEVKEPATL
jgi:glycosyltransferase involved in cell wall biosynthesis